MAEFDINYDKFDNDIINILMTYNVDQNVIVVTNAVAALSHQTGKSVGDILNILLTSWNIANGDGKEDDVNDLSKLDKPDFTIYDAFPDLK